MNFKTTVVLIVLLIGAGAALFFTRERGGGGEGEGETITARKAQKVFDDLTEVDVNKLTVTSADGKKLALEKSDGKWRLTEPVAAPADSFETDSLVRSVASLESRGVVDPKSADAKATGLANPRYTVDVASSSGGKNYTLLVGEKGAIGNNLYVSRKDKGQTLVVSAELLEKLDKPATDYRDKKLVSDVTSSAVKQITLTRPDGKIVLNRSGADDWQIAEPTAMPAEKSDVDEMLSTLTGLRAGEFVGQDAGDAKMYQLDPARITATLSFGSPTTQASTRSATQPTTQPVVIKFGRYDDVLKTNVMAMTSQSSAIAKVAASSLESLNKKPLELRDRRAADIDPAQVSSITIASDLAATTRPTSRPASKKEVTITRHKEPPVLVLAPTTKSTTTQASTTQSTTQASATTKPVQKWDVAVVDSSTTQPATKPAEAKAADDAKVDQLLTHLHPLRVRKYLEKSPTTQPTATYTIKITTQAAGGAEPVHHEIRLVDPSNSGDVTGTYNGLAFEVDRFVLDRLTGDFLKGSKPASPAPSPFANEGPPDTTGP
jgi:hypothetical protein